MSVSRWPLLTDRLPQGLHLTLHQTVQAQSKVGKRGQQRQVLGSRGGRSGLQALPWGLNPPSSWQEALCLCSQLELTSRL